MIDFEMFRPTLEAAVLNKNKGKRGAKPYDLVLLLKMSYLQEIHNLSYKQTEKECIDRYSFREFLDIDNLKDIPDANSLWNFHQKLEKNDVMRQIFDKLHSLLEEEGVILNEGKIVDATRITVPKKHKKTKRYAENNTIDNDENDKKNKRKYRILDEKTR